MHSFKFYLYHHLLEIGKMPPAWSNGSSYVFYVHRFSEYVINYMKLGVRVVFQRPTDDLSTSLPNGIAAAYTV
jgi:hypothetical protein